MNPLSAHIDVRLDTTLELLGERAPTSNSERVLATVVASAGSTYQKPGARMLILDDGSYLDLLSGGCLEADLKKHAEEVLVSGVPRAVEYDMRGPDDRLFGIGAGCKGAMRVLLERASRASRAAQALAAAASTARHGLPTSLVMVHEAANVNLGTYSGAATLPDVLISARGRRSPRPPQLRSTLKSMGDVRGRSHDSWRRILTCSSVGRVLMRYPS